MRFYLKITRISNRNFKSWNGSFGKIMRNREKGRFKGEGNKVFRETG